MSKAAETLALWRRTPFVWGQADCILSVADHVLAVTGKDPAARWRGSYKTEEGATALAESYGGVLPLCEFGMFDTGFPKAAPADGYPVVCQVGPHEIAGIWHRDRVAFRTPRGVLQSPAEVLAAWAI